MTEDIRMQFTGIISTIIDISEKACKLSYKDIDSLITNATTLNKKNVILKKMYSLEDDINKMKLAITKMNFSNEHKKDESINDSINELVKELVKEKKKKEPVKEPEKETEKETVKEPEKETEKETVKEKKKKEPVKEPEKETEKETVKEKKKKEPVKEQVKEKKKKEEKKEEIKMDPIDTIETQDKQDDPLHIKRKKIPKQIKTLVWNEYIGNDIMSNKCLCCKKEKIDIRNFHCGHVIAESKGGDLTIKNLRPICAPCNSSMGTMSMNDFALTYFGYSV